MHSNYSHFHEDKLGQQYDVKLLKRLIPFGRKYQWYFFATVFLVILITLVGAIGLYPGPWLEIVRPAAEAWAAGGVR